MDRASLYIILSVESSIYIPLYISFAVLILKSPQLRYAKSNHLLLNLSLGYLISGVSSYFVDRSGVVVLIASSGMLYSNIATLVLCIDRCICICRPFRYPTLHKGFHFVLLSCSPFVSVLSFISNIMNSTEILESERDATMKAAMGILITCTTFVLNSIVYLIFRSQRKKINVLAQGMSVSDHESRIRLFKQEVRALYLCFGCSITLTLCYLPIIVTKLCYIERKTEERLTILVLTMVITNLNPTADAFFFLWFSKEVRSSYIKLLKTFKNKIVCCI